MTKNDELFCKALWLISDMTGLDKGPTEEEYEEWHERAFQFLHVDKLQWESYD